MATNVRELQNIRAGEALAPVTGDQPRAEPDALVAADEYFAHGAATHGLVAEARTRAMNRPLA